MISCPISDGELFNQWALAHLYFDIPNATGPPGKFCDINDIASAYFPNLMDLETVTIYLSRFISMNKQIQKQIKDKDSSDKILHSYEQRSNLIKEVNDVTSSDFPYTVEP